MIVTTDPALSTSDAADVHARVYAELRAAAASKVAADLGDGLDHAEFLGEAAEARDALVRSIGGGRIEVDPDLYAGLANDDGLLVVGQVDDADLNPDVTTAALASSDTYVAAEANVAAAEGTTPDQPAATPTVEDPAPPAPAKKAPARKTAAKKAPAKKAAPRKAAAKKAPAKKAAPRKAAAKKAPAKKSAARKSTAAKKS